MIKDRIRNHRSRISIQKTMKCKMRKMEYEMLMKLKSVKVESCLELMELESGKTRIVDC